MTVADQCLVRDLSLTCKWPVGDLSVPVNGQSVTCPYPVSDLSGPVSDLSVAYHDLLCLSGPARACQWPIRTLSVACWWPVKICQWPVRACQWPVSGLSGPVSGLSGPGSGLSVACQASFADSCMVFKVFCGRSAA